MWSWIERLEELRARGRRAALVTVIRNAGSAPRDPGAKMIVLEDGEFEGTIGGGQLERLAIEDARACLASGTPAGTFRYPLGARAGQCCGGSVEVLVEVLVETLNAGPRLYLFGAGHVGQAIARVLDGTPFTVHLIDPREEWVRSGEVPKATFRHACEWRRFADRAEWDGRRTYVAVMTHLHDTDEEIIRDVVARPARFVGLIGSRAKWERFRMRLAAQGVPAEGLERVRCPIGQALGGGKAPQEVAISVAAQLLAIHYEGAME